MARMFAAGLVAGALFLDPTGAARAADTGTATVPTLKDKLEKGLKARLPSEFAFIANVVSKVNDGTLPLSLVDSTFLWARKKPRSSVRVFPARLDAAGRKDRRREDRSRAFRHSSDAPFYLFATVPASAAPSRCRSACSRTREEDAVPSPLRRRRPA